MLKEALEEVVRGGVAFAQNTRDEVRLIGGTGDHTGAVAARPGSKGQGGSLVVMASGQANAEIDAGGGLAPTLTLLHEAPIVARPKDP